MRNRGKRMTDHPDSAYYFHQGTAKEAYRYLGAHRACAEGGYQYTFRTWAPRADGVFLVGDLSDWEQGIPMERVTEGGVYEVSFFSEIDYRGWKYKFRILSEGRSFYKGDPYAFSSVGGSDGASIFCGDSEFSWGDADWLASRRSVITTREGSYIPAPINIYEVHLGSFLRHEDGSLLSYEEAADTLLAYVKYMGYTHVELMPIAEYPFDGSWGYQVCGFYAPTSRFGTPDGLRCFVDKLHRGGVGVILDWVPAHFPKDAWGLYEFDGHPLYEYQGADRMESRSWGTRYFDVGREEVQSFLVSNALYWFREFHVDGLRVDAVASMLYLDYDREPGEWIPNCYGGNRNLEAEAFLRKLNTAIYAEFPDVLMVAEESTAFGGVTRPVSEGGLGFNLKWNMGFANDFYRYLETDPLYRAGAHTALNFPVTYAFTENYVLPISHDEVVHGKKSFLDKMHGSYEEKFAQFRAALLYIMTFPGKKLLFMGSEYGQFREWDFESSLEWFMLEYEKHDALREYTAALNRFYLDTPPLYECDFEGRGFAWALADAAAENVVAYRRVGLDGAEVLAVISFSGSRVENLSVPVPEGGSYACIFSTEPVGGEPLTAEADGDGRAHLTLNLNPFFGAVYRRIEDSIKL